MVDHPVRAGSYLSGTIIDHGVADTVDVPQIFFGKYPGIGRQSC
jgi:hypothetical protein